MKFLVALFLMTSFIANAEVLYVGTDNGITVLLTDEPCELSSINNLPNKAVWVEGGKSIEGCYGAVANGALVLMYLIDKRVTAAHSSLFRRAVGA